MIRNIVLENFQSHKDTTLKFSPKITVITGSSNSGKTAVLRALNWVVNNRPLGDSFIRRGTSNAEVSIEVSNGEDGAIIARKRDKKENCYTVTTGDTGFKFEALKSDIPKEITDLINFSDINIQKQLSPYFLVLESPGHVAQYIRNVSKLENIDILVSSASSHIKIFKGKLDESFESLNNFRILLAEAEKINIQVFEIMLTAYKKFVTAQDKLTDDIKQLTNIICSLDDTARKLKAIPDNVAFLITSCESTCEVLNTIQTRKSQLATLVRQIADIEAQYEKIPQDIDTLYKTCENTITQYEQIYSKKLALASAIKNITDAHNNIETYNIQYVTVEDEIQRIKTQLVQCPTCGQNLTPEARDRMLE